MCSKNKIYSKRYSIHWMHKMTFKYIKICLNSITCQWSLERRSYCHTFMTHWLLSLHKFLQIKSSNKYFNNICGFIHRERVTTSGGYVNPLETDDFHGENSSLLSTIHDVEIFLQYFVVILKLQNYYKILKKGFPGTILLCYLSQLG